MFFKYTVPFLILLPSRTISIPCRTIISSRTTTSSSSSSSSIRLFSTVRPKPILVSIEGNIGAGKSTLLTSLRENYPQWIYIDEPVEAWSKILNDNGESILEVFYKDRKRWSYTFQNCALLTRYQNIESAVMNVNQRPSDTASSSPLVFFTERCLDTDYHVFTKMLRDESSIDKLELELYERLLNQLKTTASPLSAIIYVNTPPEQCMDRIKQRSRSGEDAISIEYLKAIDYYQMKWIDSTTVPTFKCSSDVSNTEPIRRFIDYLILTSTL